MLGFATLLIGSYSRFGVWRQVIWAVVALIGVQFLVTAAESQVARMPDQWPLIYVSPLVGGIGVFLLWLAARPCPRTAVPKPRARSRRPRHDPVDLCRAPLPAHVPDHRRDVRRDPVPDRHRRTDPPLFDEDIGLSGAAVLSLLNITASFYSILP